MISPVQSQPGWVIGIVTRGGGRMKARVLFMRSLTFVRDDIEGG
ncbi:hypothetical protein [Rhodohalobacter sulfatireducens]|nr:hypothetical protein [Rhodohalobacter sulfatireducens]